MTKVVIKIVVETPDHEDLLRDVNVGLVGIVKDEFLTEFETITGITAEVVEE